MVARLRWAGAHNNYNSECAWWLPQTWESGQLVDYAVRKSKDANSRFVEWFNDKRTATDVNSSQLRIHYVRTWCAEIQHFVSVSTCTGPTAADLNLQPSDY